MLGKNLINAAAGNAGGAAAGAYIEDVFSTYLYTGTASAKTITNGIDLDGEGGLVWIKTRVSGNAFNYGHVLSDTENGPQKYLRTDTTDAIVSFSEAPTFNSDGFSFGVWSSLNISGGTYASWTFRKAPKFFDVVTYTGTGSARTVSHSLGSVPGCIIVKRTDTTGDWQVYHRANTANPETDYLVLNSTAATVDSNTRWNDTAPTDSVFTVGTEATVNASGGTYVAYLFAHDAGGFGDDGEQNVISCGSFTNSGTVNINLGWEPQWLLLKRPDATGAWFMLDTMRGWTADATATYLLANASGAESAIGAFDGIRPSATGISAIGGGGNNYIYIAIRRGPMKTPTSGTEVYNAIQRTGTGTTTGVTGVGFPPDLIINKRKDVSNGGPTEVWDKLRGRAARLQANLTGAETSFASSTQDLMSFDMDGMTVGEGAYSQINYLNRININWFFRRAPKFMDVVCYTGTGVSGRTVTHNLGVIPEMMIVKGRNQSSTNWAVYSKSIANSQTLYLNATNAASSGATYWNSTSPTDTVFTVGDNGDTNVNTYTYVAYLFATLAGVSKVGSYTGTGTTLAIDCGFSAGARFVLIKRTDSTGDWYIWDSTRGIVSGNDPYLISNSTATEVTSTDYIDPSSAGFEISSTAPAAINASGGSFIFLAIA
jgi:hypothetical protein